MDYFIKKIESLKPQSPRVDKGYFKLVRLNIVLDKNQETLVTGCTMKIPTQKLVAMHSNEQSRFLTRLFVLYS